MAEKLFVISNSHLDPVWIWRRRAGRAAWINGPNMVEACRQACKVAKSKGIKISCDLNYRGKLWTRAQANAAMTELAKYIDVCISNEEDAKDVFGIEAEATDIYGGTINHEGYKSVEPEIFPGVPRIFF